MPMNRSSLRSSSFYESPTVVQLQVKPSSRGTSARSISPTEEGRRTAPRLFLMDLRWILRTFTRRLLASPMSKPRVSSTKVHHDRSSKTWSSLWLGLLSSLSTDFHSHLPSQSVTKSRILISTESDRPPSARLKGVPFSSLCIHYSSPFSSRKQPTGPNLAGRLLVFYELIAHFLIFVSMSRICKHIMCSVQSLRCGYGRVTEPNTQRPEASDARLGLDTISGPR